MNPLPTGTKSRNQRSHLFGALIDSGRSSSAPNQLTTDRRLKIAQRGTMVAARPLPLLGGSRRTVAKAQVRVDQSPGREPNHSPGS